MSHTVEEKRHLDKVAALGCILCRMPACCHHINSKTMGRRSSDFESIPLCHRHHQGEEGIHHLGTRAWEKKYKPEMVFLHMTLVEIYGPYYENWPVQTLLFRSRLEQAQSLRDGVENIP